MAKIEGEAQECAPSVHAHGRAILVEAEMSTEKSMGTIVKGETNRWIIGDQPEIPPTATLRLVLS